MKHTNIMATTRMKARTNMKKLMTTIPEKYKQMWVKCVSSINLLLLYVSTCGRILKIMQIFTDIVRYYKYIIHSLKFELTKILLVFKETNVVIKYLCFYSNTIESNLSVLYCLCHSLNMRENLSGSNMSLSSSAGWVSFSPILNRISVNG